MPYHPDLDELDKLWPEEGYAIIIEDEWKPPDSDDFVNILTQFAEPEVNLPNPRTGYSYWVHDADRNRYYRDGWQEHMMMHELGDAVQTVREQEDVEATLNDLRKTGQEWWKRDDVLWFEIVLSLATHGVTGSSICR